MTKKSKMTFGFLAVLAIVAISAFGIHSIHKTHEKLMDLNDDIEWDI